MAFPLAASAQYAGKVFVDVNHNGRWDKGETLVKDVSVSDGLNVVRTDTKGRFSLPGHAKERFIFITTPSGFKTDQAYYCRIEGKDKSYDFALLPYCGGVKKDGSHSFIHISDTEIGQVAGHDEWIAGMRDYAANEHVAFIMHTGDICYRPGLESHIQIMNSANMPETQVFYSIGNHDLVSGNYGEEYFESLYGPAWYSFDVGNTHYIVTPMYGGDHWPSYRKKDVYAWMVNDLKYVPKSKAIYLFNHSIADDMEHFRLSLNEKEYIDLPAHNLKAWLYGHWHVNHVHRHPATGVCSICSSTPVYGGIDHASSAFRVMHIDGKGDFTSELRYSYLDKSMAFASIQNRQAPVLPSGAVPLSVNVYSTVSPVVSLRYSCFFDGKRMVADAPMAQQTDFNWYAEMHLPASVDGQYITVQVDAVFSNGEKARQKTVFRYERQATAQPSVAADWTSMLGNAAHVGIVADTLSQPRLAWVKNVGSNIYMASPLVYQGAVYVASVDDNETGRATLVRMDARTGEVKWRYRLAASVRNNIAIDAGKLFAQDVHGILYAVDVETGQLSWKADLEIGVVPPLNDGLVAAKGVVYAGTGKSMAAFDAASGRRLWRNTGWDRGEGCTATLSLSDAGVLIGHAHWGGLFANDAATGKMLWGSWDGELRHRSSSAAMWGDVFYILSAQSLFVMEARTGRILTRKKLGYDVNVSSTPLVTETEIIFGTSNRGIVALDRETYEEKWNFRTKPAMILSAPYIGNHPVTVEASPLLSGGTVYVGASDGSLYALDRKKGSLLWKHTTGAPVFAAMSISGNMLYAADFSGNVYGFVCDVKARKTK